jgi:leader peptidase (prepilin peptidase)/N-methyltransferase
MLNELITQFPYYCYLMIAFVSLCVGSLLNVVIYRLPIMLRQMWLEEVNDLMGNTDAPTEKSINLFLPRSFCPQCKHEVAFWHNIPILSYLLLRAKCAYCRAPISIRYPLIEALTLVLSMCAVWHFGLTIALLYALLAIWLLIPMFFIDLDHQLLPDCLTLGLLWVGLLANCNALFTPLPNAVIGAALAYVSLWGFIKLFYLITGKIGMGHGDFKLFAAFGAWFGWTILPFILFFASVSGAIIGVTYLKLTKQAKETAIPFGPYLCMCGLLALFFGQQFLQWYLSCGLI